MPRLARRQSSSSIYHVMNRGTGKQIIFEDDADRSFFMKRLDLILCEARAKLLAWCLMDNHFHLLLEIEHDTLAPTMHRLQTSYAGYFNRVHGHTGALFGSRFHSEPVEDDKYLMTVVRYIHENPVEARYRDGLLYRWSSYPEYLGTAVYADTSLVESVFGSKSSLRAFHEDKHERDRCMDFAARSQPALSDIRAREIVRDVLGRDGEPEVRALPREERNRVLIELRQRGLGVRQLQRLTGVSLGIISNVTATVDER